MESAHCPAYLLCCFQLCLAVMRNEQSISVCAIHVIQCIGNDNYRHVQPSRIGYCPHSFAASTVAIEASFIALSEAFRTRVGSLQHYTSFKYSCKP